MTSAITVPRRSSRPLRNPSVTVASMAKDAMAPKRRWLNSRMECMLDGGMTCPWHRGQSGQPSPEPTMPPMTIRT
jgi:hypothetical protein